MKKMTYELQLNLSSYWRAGSGSSGGAYADLLVIKQQGLPYFPGKQLKGILKDVFVTANNAGWFGNKDNNLIEQLFGVEGPSGQGLLEISNAQLSDKEAQWFKEDKKRISMLYHTKDTQAVDHKTGTTKIGSLRTMEVTIPLTLIATIGLRNDVLTTIDQNIADNFKSWLKSCCNLITVIGAERNRGLGNVSINVVEKKS